MKKLNTAVNNNKQQGFTLIELVIVIVILGILAATAAPKFINLQGDAKVSAQEGVLGGIKSAINIGYAKTAISGDLTDDSGTVLIQGLYIHTVYGYPSASSLGDGSGDSAVNAIGILGLMDIDPADTTATAAVAGPPAVGAKLSVAIASDCSVILTDATAVGGSPTVEKDGACA